MFHLDYISCVLTIISTALVGTRRWQGWLLASANSVIICFIGVRTHQLGFVPANVFCLALYGYNIIQWRKTETSETPSPVIASDNLNQAVEGHHVSRSFATKRRRTIAAHERPLRYRDRIPAHRLPGQS
jgi:hypothetical protein